FAPAGVPDERQGGPSPEDVGRFRRQMETLNCGFVKAEILGGGFVPMGGAPQNVGYLKFNFFADTALCAPTASAAMNFIANTGALPVRGHKIDEHFMIGVPFARAINPISKSNWEGIGVEPDVKVSADDALATAQRLIAERVRP